VVTYSSDGLVAIEWTTILGFHHDFEHESIRAGSQRSGEDRVPADEVAKRNMQYEHVSVSYLYQRTKDGFPHSRPAGVA